MAREPLAIPTLFLSLLTKPISLPEELSFQNCKIKTPQMMNKAQPTAEKKRSEKEVDALVFQLKKQSLMEQTKSLVDGRVHNVTGKQGNQNDGEADECSIDKHDSVLICVLSHAVVVQHQACDCDDLRNKENIHEFAIELDRQKLVLAVTFYSIQSKWR